MTRSTPSRPHRCLFALPCSFTGAEKDPGGRCWRFLLDSGADFGACSAQGLGHLVIQLCGARICFDMVDGNESGVTCMTSARGIMPHVPVSLCCSVHRSRARSSSSAVDKFSQRRVVEIHGSSTSLPPSVSHTTTDPPSSNSFVSGRGPYVQFRSLHQSNHRAHPLICTRGPLPRPNSFVRMSPPPLP